MQVRESIKCLNISDLMCDLGATVYTLVWFELEIRAFHGVIDTKMQSKFLREWIHCQ